MNVKKEVFRQIKNKLEDEIQSTRYAINRRKCNMKDLAEKQTIDKRKIAELTKLYNEFLNKEKGETK